MKESNAIIIFTLYLSFIFALIAFTISLDSVPVVHWSYTQDKCVEVFSDDYDCDNLPKKYERAWVK